MHETMMPESASEWCLACRFLPALKSSPLCESCLSDSLEARDHLTQLICRYEKTFGLTFARTDGQVELPAAKHDTIPCPPPYDKDAAEVDALNGRIEWLISYTAKDDWLVGCEGKVISRERWEEARLLAIRVYKELPTIKMAFPSVSSNGSIQLDWADIDTKFTVEIQKNGFFCTHSVDGFPAGLISLSHWCEYQSELIDHIHKVFWASP